MTAPRQLHFTLKSDTTFGRGEGVPGEVDAEVQHDALGLPYYGGRSLKGILAQECADLLYALNQQKADRWWQAAARLFGEPGSTGDTTGTLIVGDAQVAAGVRRAVASAKLSPKAVLASLTTVRRQTANDVKSGAPQEQTLRAMRVVLRGTTFTAPLQFRTDAGDDELALLAACVVAARRLGMGRNRGRGEVVMWMTDEQHNALTADFERFVNQIVGVQPA